ncbi:MAG: RNA polymerase II mediator complex subunit [Peltula sp. TS41687]|nr:MAG: RNA polymerase II mediator complex subunit [Peltula sp. TS41687]
MTLRIKDSKALDQERQKGGVVVEPWSITVLHFVIIRSILEGMRELSVLADIIGLVSGSRNPMVLSSLADTLNYHRTAFEVMGTLQISFETLLQRYQSLRAVKVTDPSLLRSLADLAIRIPRAQHIGRHLHSELNGNVYKGSIAAFSPVSNPTIEMSQSAESDFHEEIERLLSTGTSIDQQTLTRLFKDIITRLEHISNRQISMDSSCYINNLLVKLRCLDTRGFDELMDAWISHVMKSKPSLTFFHALESMVVSGCLLLGSVTACSVKFLQSKAGTDIELAQAEVAMGTLQLITSAASNIVDQEQYRLQLLQSQFAIDHPTEWLAVLHQAIECVSLAESSNLMTRLKNLLANKANIYRLRTLVIGNTQEVCDGVVMPLLKKAGSLVGELIDILDPATEPYTTKGKPGFHPAFACNMLRLAIDNGSDAKSQLAEVVHQVNHLSLPFCKIKVLGLCITEAEDESQSSLLETFLEEAQKLDGLANDVFTELIGVLASHQLRQINELAQARLMDCLMRLETSVRPTVKGSERPKTEQGIIQLYLSIIQTTAHRLQQSAILEMGSALTSRLNQLVRILNEDRQKKISHITERRRSQTINLQNISLSTSKCISADHNRIAIYLNAILLLLLDSTYIIPSLTEYTHDVLAQLIDDLPDDHRRQCINFLKDKPSHPLVRYLFSIADGSETESKLYITGSSSSSRTAQRQPTMHGSGASGGGGSSSNVTNSKKASTTTTTTTQPLQLRHWELLSEPTPVMGENDTSLNLKLFGARKC